MFECPSHDYAGASDFAKIIDLVEDDRSEEESKQIRDAGAVRANELLSQHRDSSLD
jgi:hypothetical protein